jgi:hypothetical protein
MDAAHPIRCRCGKLQARLAQPARGIRAICYCRDCRAYAHFLGPPDGMLDERGGTAVVVVHPRTVTFLDGVEHLACMSLSPRGTLRWFARCCRTPVGNTPRDVRIAYLGLVHDCLEQGGAPLDASFGPVAMQVNRQSAIGGDPGGTSTVAVALAGARLAASLGWARVSGGYRDNPFFDASGKPRIAPEVVTRAARDALMQRV